MRLPGLILGACLLISNISWAQTERAAFLYGDYRCETPKKIKLLRELLDSPAFRSSQAASDRRQEVTDQIWEFCLRKPGMSNQELLQKRRHAINLAVKTFGGKLYVRSEKTGKTNWGQLKEYLETESLGRDDLAPDGWSALNMARRAQKFHTEYNLGANKIEVESVVVPIRYPEQFGDFLLEARRSGGYDLIAIFAHSGVYDGYRFGSQGASPLQKLASLPGWTARYEAMVDRLVEKKGYDVSEARNLIRRNLEENRGSWEVKQSSVVRFWLDNFDVSTQHPEARVQEEIYWPGIKVDENLFPQAFRDGGVFFMGGCKNAQIAQRMLKKFEKAQKDIMIISFVNSVRLEGKAIDVFQDILSGGDFYLLDETVQVLLWP